MKKLFYIAPLYLLLLSCSKENIEVNRTVSLDAFDRIEIMDPFDVYLIEGAEYSVKIECNEDFADYVELTVSDSVLQAQNSRKRKAFTPRRNKMKLYITAPALKKVTLTGGCYVKTLTPITSNEFGIIMTGKSCEADIELSNNIFYYWNYFPTGGQLKLSGTANYLRLWNFAIMSIEAKDLIAQEALVENSSKGNCIITVTQKLTYKIEGEGNVEVYGNPNELVNEGIEGDGELIKH